jgi:predicted GIY-YIG superfamily endonuclease
MAYNGLSLDTVLARAAKHCEERMALYESLPGGERLKYISFERDKREATTAELRRVGLTTKRVAELMEIAPVTVQRWYAGKCGISPWALEAIKKLYLQYFFA